MKSTFALSIVLPAALAPAALAQQSAPSAPVRSLDEALKIALERSPSLLQVEVRQEKTKQTIEQVARASRRPSVSAGATYTRLSGFGAAFGGGGFSASPSQLQNPFPVGLQTTPPGSAPVTLGGGFSNAAGATRARQVGGDGQDVDLNQYSMRLSISQLVDFTGITRATGHLGEIENDIVRQELQRVRQEIAFNVKSAYYNILRAQALVGVSEAAVAQSEAQLKVAEAQFRNGVVAAFDVLRAQTQLANNKQSLIQARNQVAISKNAFANTIGLDPATPIELPAPPPVEEQSAIPTLPDLNEAALVEKALKQRPEAAQAELNIEKSKKASRLARRSLEPYGSLGLNANFNPKPALVSNEKTTGTLSFTLNAPIYDGGATRAAVASAHADERSAAIQQDQFLRGIKAEVEQAIVAVRDAEERARAAWASVEQARESYRLAGVRYREGVDTQLPVNDAQAALVQAESNVVNARYDYLSALARLARATGERM